MYVQCKNCCLESGSIIIILCLPPAERRNFEFESKYSEMIINILSEFLKRKKDEVVKDDCKSISDNDDCKSISDNDDCKTISD